MALNDDTLLEKLKISDPKDQEVYKFNKCFSMFFKLIFIYTKGIRKL
jgi:hypothetical protein